MAPFAVGLVLLAAQVGTRSFASVEWIFFGVRGGYAP